MSRCAPVHNSTRKLLMRRPVAHTNTSTAITLQLVTVKEPASEHMARYTSTFSVPCCGATQKMRYTISANATMEYKRKPAAAEQHDVWAPASDTTAVGQEHVSEHVQRTAVV